MAPEVRALRAHTNGFGGPRSLTVGGFK
jgi:hypothetical protein